MNFQIEEISPVERKVSVTVPAEEVNAAIAATTALYGRSVEVKGFRKGKVPASVIESKFRKQIVGEATQDLVNFQLNEIMSELKLTPMSGINVDSGEMEKSKEFTYSFSFEVAPKIDLPEYKGLEVEQEKVVIDEKEVDAVIERILGNMAELVDIEEDRKAEDGDFVTVDFAALGDDKDFEGLRANNFQLELGTGQSLEDFEKIVKTLKKGEAGKGNMTFPEDFLNEELAGRTVEMRVTLHSIQKKVLPELTDDVAKRAGGFESVEKMREAIENSYVQSRTSLHKSVAQKKLLDQLMEGLEIPLPPSLLERNIQNIVAEQVERLEQQGKSLASTGKTLDELREEARPMAEEASRTQMFLLAVAANEDFTVSPEEVDQELRALAMRTGQDYENLRMYHEQTGLNIMIKDRLLADRAMELIYANAKVTEVEPAKEEEKSKKAVAKKAASKKTAKKAEEKAEEKTEE